VEEQNRNGFEDLSVKKVPKNRTKSQRISQCQI